MRKNRFWTLIFSFIPGCGHMYLGYMKRGLQFMVMFVATICLTYISASMFVYWISIVFGFLIPITWLYQLADALHLLSGLKRRGMEVPADDEFFFPTRSGSIMKNVTFKKIIAVILILCGGSWILFTALDTLAFVPILRDIFNMLRRYLVSALVSVALILGGLRLLKGNNNSNSSDG